MTPDSPLLELLNLASRSPGGHNANHGPSCGPGNSDCSDVRVGVRVGASPVPNAHSRTQLNLPVPFPTQRPPAWSPGSAPGLRSATYRAGAGVGVTAADSGIRTGDGAREVRTALRIAIHARAAIGRITRA
jgi:hypothetical protein